MKAALLSSPGFTEAEGRGCASAVAQSLWRDKSVKRARLIWNCLRSAERLCDREENE